MTRLWLTLLTAAVALSACDLPRDPQGTLEEVRGGTLKVGIIENEEWARMEDGRAAGVEPALVRQLAESLNAEVEWIRGPEHELIEALHRYRLHLVVGGLKNDSTWSGKVALTIPYAKVPLEVGAPPGMPPVGSIDGRPVGVPQGSALAARVEERGGVPVELEAEQLAGYDGLVAAPRWRLEGWGRVPVGVELHKHEHVWAAPPGENRWLVEVERFLERRRGEVTAMLAAEAEVQR